MKLQLKNPVVILDLETTGMNITTDRIVEIALLKVNIDGSEEERLMRINPEIPIPPEVSQIHGIYNEDVINEPTFRQVAKTLAKFIEGCDLCGFNSNRFDIPINLLMCRLFFIKWKNEHWQQLTNFIARRI